ncbi:hypothetical protein [Streptomyces sp. NPDC020951]|uniref:hypothetical protein n=1 Tax=Streptomyces sp. NPDC020951 TaxID=3365104 RepID=UPI0037BCF86B
MGMLVGVGPYLVDSDDGSVHTICVVAYAVDAWEDDYRYRVKGLPRPGVHDALPVAVAGALTAEGRVAAMHLLRKRAAPHLLRQALEYVATISRGEEPLEELAEPAAGPREAVLVLPITTVSGPASPPV